MDNAGEIIFDLPLLRLLLDRGYRVILAGKALPHANDMTAGDLRALLRRRQVREYLGEDRVRRIQVIASGAAMSGMDLRRATRPLIQAWQRATVIYAKGQGMVETLRYDPPPRRGLKRLSRPVFHALQVKTPEYFREPVELRRGDALFVRTPAASGLEENGAKRAFLLSLGGLEEATVAVEGLGGDRQAYPGDFVAVAWAAGVVRHVDERYVCDRPSDLDYYVQRWRALPADPEFIAVYPDDSFVGEPHRYGRDVVIAAAMRGMVWSNRTPQQFFLPQQEGSVFGSGESYTFDHVDALVPEIEAARQALARGAGLEERTMAHVQAVVRAVASTAFPRPVIVRFDDDVLGPDPRAGLEAIQQSARFLRGQPACPVLLIERGGSEASPAPFPVLHIGRAVTSPWNVQLVGLENGQAISSQVATAAMLAGLSQEARVVVDVREYADLEQMTPAGFEEAIADLFA